MDDPENVWYRLGYTLEQAQGKLTRPKRLRTLAERDAPRKVRDAEDARPQPRPRAEPAPDDDDSEEDDGMGDRVDSLLKKISPTGESWDAVIAAGTTALIGRLVESLPRKRKPGIGRLVRAGAAGAGAALVRELVRSFRSGGIKKDEIADMVKDAVLSGAARGLLYGTLIEPRIPGPPIVRGAAYGYVEHLVTPLGGLTNILGSHAPHRSIPFISDLLDEIDPSEETLMEHIFFGITMAALYGALPADPEEDDEDEDED